MAKQHAEIRYSRRILTILYIVFVAALCAATTVSIVSTLRAQGNSEVQPPAPQKPESPSAKALAELRTLYQELRERGERVGRNHPQKPIDIARWDAWTVEWRTRADRLGQRYGLSGKGARAGTLARALQSAFQKMLALLGAYDLAAKNLAAARKTALEEVARDLHDAARALSGKPPADPPTMPR
jgi:hypothetical protein